jgi:hypothetical protein
MGKIFNKLYVLLLVILVTGCASNAPKFNEVKVDFPAVDSSNGRVYLYRPSKFMGGGYTPQIFLNDINVGKLESGSFFFIDRPEGEYSIDSGNGDTRPSDPENYLKFSLAKGETKYIKFTFAKVGVALFLVKVASPVVHPEIVTKEIALVDLSEVSYISSSAE